MSRIALASWIACVSSFFLACDPGSIEISGDDAVDGGATSDSDGATPNPVEGEPAELQGILAAHNQVRTAHGVAAMEWDNDLAAIAQAWADGCAWGHNDARSESYPSYVGENIFGASFVPSGQAVTDSWASEEANYDYDANTCNGVCGHYTQIVWADSVKLGCGFASCPGGEVANFVVCDYGPGGNVGGQRPY